MKEKFYNLNSYKEIEFDEHQLINHQPINYAPMKKTSGRQTLLRGLATVNFFAADIKAAKKWYSELLGIEPYFGYPDSEHPAYI